MESGVRGSDGAAAGGQQRRFQAAGPLLLQELQELARRHLKTERPGHTLQATALEAYLRLVGDQARDWQDRAHFIGVSASIMRRDPAMRSCLEAFSATSQSKAT